MLELLDYLLGGLLQKELVKPPHCKACHARTTLTGKPRLFLLPLWQDQAEDLSAEFYLRGCRPISGLEQIPTGQQACRVWAAECPRCGERWMVAQNFLLVRGGGGARGAADLPLPGAFAPFGPNGITPAEKFPLLFGGEHGIVSLTEKRE